jgi:hypothetical protein
MWSGTISCSELATAHPRHEQGAQDLRERANVHHHGSHQADHDDRGWHRPLPPRLRQVHRRGPCGESPRAIRTGLAPSRRNSFSRWTFCRREGPSPSELDANRHAAAQWPCRRRPVSSAAPPPPPDCRYQALRLCRSGGGGAKDDAAAPCSIRRSRPICSAETWSDRCAAALGLVGHRQG